MVFNPDPPRSRASLARRSGIGVSLLAVVMAGLAHVAGWRAVLTGMGVFAAAAVVVIGFRKIRARRSGPGGLRMPRMPSVGMTRGARGFPFRAGSMPPGLRIPRGARGMPMGRALGAHRAGRGRMPSLRPGMRSGMRGLGGPGRRAIGSRGVAGGRRALGAGSSARRGGIPRIRSAASIGRARRLGTPAGGRTGRRFRPFGGGRATRSASLRPGTAYRPGGRRGSPGAAGRHAGRMPRTRAFFRQAVRAMRGGTVPGAAGRPGAARPGYTPPSYRRPRFARGARTAPRASRSRRFRSRRHGAWTPRVTVRGGPRRSRFRMPWRRTAGPAPVRPYAQRRSFAASVRRRVRMGRRRFTQTRVRVRRLGVTGPLARLRGSLLFWRRRRPRPSGSGPHAVSGTIYTVRPPSGAAGPYASQMPRPGPRVAPGWRPTPAPAYTPAQPPSHSGGSPMADSPIAPLIEAVDTHLGGFRPESALDFERFFKDNPDLFEAMAKAYTTAINTLEEASPVDSSVVEDMREYVATLNGLRDKATEIHQKFQRIHEVELRRIHDPRSGERQFDVAANQE